MAKEKLTVKDAISIVFAANDIRTPNRLAIGDIRTILGRVASHTISSSASRERFERSLISLLKHGDPLADKWFQVSANKLRKELITIKKIVDLPSLSKGLKTEEVQEAIEILDQTVYMFQSAARVRVGSSISPTNDLFDELRVLGKRNPTIQDALNKFQEGLHTGDDTALHAAAEELKNAVGPVNSRKGFQDSLRLRKGIDEIVDHILDRLPTGDGERAALNFSVAINSLPSSNLLRKIHGDFIDGAIRKNPDRWLAICEVVARAKRGATPNQVSSMIFKTMAGMSELLGTQLHLYQKLWRDKLHEARLLREKLGEGWRIRTVRRDVRAPAVEGSGFKLFYDDAIFLVNESDGKAICTLAVQNKSGDWSSRKVVAQIKKDLTRELLGHIKINDITYKLVPGVNPPTRLFVGTILPQKEPLVGIQFIPLPIKGTEFFQLAHLLLKANGKL